MKLLFLDTETTGNEPKDRLCQICFKNADGIECGLFKPPLPISVKSMSITHITNEMVADKPPFSHSQLYKKLEELLADHILIAHNALFDIGMLEAEGLKAPQHICTLKVARHLDQKEVIPEYKLQYLRYYLNLQVPDAHAHDAKGDVLVLEALFGRLLEKMMEQHGDAEAAVAAMVEVSKKPLLIRTIHFGKYRGTKLSDLARQDPGYMDWLLRQKEIAIQTNPTDTDSADWVYSLKHYLKTRA